MCPQSADGAFMAPGFGDRSDARMVERPGAAAGHDPCQPRPPGHSYFNATAQLTDLVHITVQGQTLRARGVLIPMNESKAVEVDLYSDGPVRDWLVFASDLSDSTGRRHAGSLGWSLPLLLLGRGRSVPLGHWVRPGEQWVAAPVDHNSPESFPVRGRALCHPLAEWRASGLVRIREPGIRAFSPPRVRPHRGALRARSCASGRACRRRTTGRTRKNRR